jgi:hypothetical protein
MSQSGVSEPAGSSARSLLGEFNFVGARTWSANIDSVVGIRR